MLLTDSLSLFRYLPGSCLRVHVQGDISINDPLDLHRISRGLRESRASGIVSEFTCVRSVLGILL